MKLHLPKGLLVALMASVISSVPQAKGDTGLFNGHSYLIGGPKGWGGGVSYDTLTGDPTEITPEGGKLTTTVTKIDSSSLSSFNIWADSGANAWANAIVEQWVVADNATITVSQSSWKTNNQLRYFDELRIKELVGNANLNVSIADNKVVIDKVSGSLKSVSNAGTLTIGKAAVVGDENELIQEASTTYLSGSITNTGNLTLNGTFTFDVSSFDNYVKVEGSGGTTIVEKNERGNGFITYVGADYYLLNNSSGTQLITSAATIKTANDLETKKLDDQSVVVTAGQTLSSVYAVVSGTETYGGNSSTVDAGATAIQVSKGAELVLAGDYDIRKITGEGTLTLAKDYTLANGVHSVGEGTLKINSGVILTVGGGPNQNAGIASYEAVELAGGTLKFHCNGGTVHNLTVNSESTLRIEDMSNQMSVIKLDGNTTLNDKLDLTHNFKGTLNIVKLTGTGDLHAVLHNNGYDDALRVTIDSIDKYSGTITYDNSANRGNAKLTLGADANSVVNLGTTVSVINAPVDLNGQFTLDDKNGTFELYGEVSGLSDGENGFRLFTGDQYYLVHGDESITIDTTDISSVTLTSGVATTLDKETVAGSVIFKGEAYKNRQGDNVYYVNTTVGSTVASDAVFKVNAEGAVLNVVDTLSNKYISYVAGSVNVADTGTLIIDTATGDAVNVLLNATGEGDITLSTSARLTGNVATKVAGTLTISNKAQLDLGSADLWDTDNNTATGTGADISSFTAVNLDNGTIRIQNPSATIKNLTVTANGGVIDANDLANDPERYKINLLGNTTLNGILTYKNEWNTYTEIENLTGSGNLIIDGSNRSVQDNSTFSILKATNYDGIVQMTNKANNMSLKVAQNLGLNVKVGTTSGEIDLTGIGSGNTITLAAAVGGIKSGTVAADVVVKNAKVGNNMKAGMEILTATDNTSIVYTGKFSGDGNYIIGAQKTVEVDNGEGGKTNQTVNVTTSTTFSGDTSGFTGQLRVSKGEQNITFTGSATAVNSSIVVDNNATANVTLDHTQAATVTKALKPAGTLNLVVKNTAAEGTTFSNAVNATNATIKAGTVAKFTSGDVQMTNLLVETGAQLSFTAKDALNVSNLEVANVGTITVANGGAAGSIIAGGAVTLNGGATINAAVVDLNGASSVSFDVASGAIELNGALTMSSTKAFVDALDLTSLSAVDTLAVFTGVSSFTVGGVTYDASNALTNVDLRDWGADAAVGQYTLTYDTSANVGSIVIINRMDAVPEPASATLSLAALMMLCARRRRRK